MPEAEGERGAVKGGRRTTEGAAKGRAAPPGPPKFINRRLLTSSPTHAGARFRPRGARAAGQRQAAAGLLRALRAGRGGLFDARPAVLRAAPAVQLDFYVEALLQAMRPLALGLRSRGLQRVINVAVAPQGVPLAQMTSSCFVTRQRGDWMARNPVIRTLATVSLEEALAYLDAADGDELTAADNLARERNRLEGTTRPPDETEIHHALFLLRRARGLDAPSFDLMRVQLRRRHAA